MTAQPSDALIPPCCRDHEPAAGSHLCWIAAEVRRQGAVLDRIAAAGTGRDPDGMPAGWAEMHEDLAEMERRAGDRDD